MCSTLLLSSLGDPESTFPLPPPCTNSLKCFGPHPGPPTINIFRRLGARGPEGGPKAPKLPPNVSRPNQTQTIPKPFPAQTNTIPEMCHQKSKKSNLLKKIKNVKSKTPGCYRSYRWCEFSKVDLR